MSYWKCSIELYTSPILREIIKPTHPRDGFMSARESIFIRLLTYCAGGHEFCDARQFSRVADVPEKQCKIVWDICINEGVLKESTNGFSAKKWMYEQGLLDARMRAKIAPNQSLNADGVTMPLTPKIEQTANKEQNATSGNWNSQSKISVRSNVYLTCEELEELKKQFKEEEIALMLDRLSEYKKTSNRRYNSDYEAIHRWVIKWLESTRNKSSTTLQEGEFPSWLTGRKEQ